MKNPIKKLNAFVAVGLTLSMPLFASACGEERLDTPTGFEVNEENLLTWDVVEDARSYTVEITPVDTGTSETATARNESYSLASLDEGDYLIRVMATGGRQNALTSDWSATFEFHKDYETGCVYRLINNNTEYEIYDVGSASGEIVIEDYYRGRPVTQIAELASSRLTKVTIGNNVRSIGANAFSGCTGLTEIVIPDSVVEIGMMAFQSCNALTSVTLPAHLTELPQNAFAYCTSLEEVQFGEELETIGDMAFYASGIAEADIPDSVVEIGKNAFSHTDSLERVSIGAGVESIGDYAFSQSTALSEVVFAEGGALTEIGENAFSECDALVSIDLPEGLEVVGGKCFYAAEALAEVTLPDSVTAVGEFAFRNTQIYNEQVDSGYVYAGNWLVEVSSETLASLTEIVQDTLREDTVGIADQVFYGSPELRKVTLPQSVRHIGDYAFYGCTVLNAFTARDGALETVGDYAFSRCSVLSNVQFGESLKDIGSYAFQSCPMVQNNVYSDYLVPSSVTRVGTRAFYNTGLWNSPDDSGVIYAGNWVVGFSDISSNFITLQSGTVGISDYAFYQCTAIESVNGMSSVRHIGRGAFRECTRLGLLVLGQEVERIEDYTFDSCTALYSVDIPDGITYIGQRAFYNCANFSSSSSSAQSTEVDLSDSEVTEIGQRAFYGCAGIQSLRLGEKVETIGNYAFYQCAGLTEIVIPDSVKSIGERAFAYCEGLTGLTIGTGVESIGDYAFRNCASLTSLEIPGNVKEIGDYAFFQCSGIRTLTFGNGVETIGDYAFYGLTEIETLLFPESLLYIGDFAFRNANGLTSVVLYGTVEYVGSHAFYGNKALTVYIASGEEISENWSTRWNSSFRPVVWNCTLSVDQSYVVSVTVGEGTVENPFALGGISAPVREGYTFVGWSLTPGGTTVAYSARALATAPAGTTVYSIWERTPETPETPEAPEDPSAGAE